MWNLWGLSLSGAESTILIIFHLLDTIYKLIDIKVVLVTQLWELLLLKYTYKIIMLQNGAKHATLSIS